LEQSIYMYKNGYYTYHIPWNSELGHNYSEDNVRARIQMLCPLWYFSFLYCYMLTNALYLHSI